MIPYLSEKLDTWQNDNNHSNYPKVVIYMSEPSYEPKNKIITDFYNYPNPITDGFTKFRFFVNETTDQIEIKIYDVLGNLVDTIVKMIWLFMKIMKLDGMCKIINQDCILQR